MRARYSSSTEEYKIAAGDVVSVSVLEAAEMEVRFGAALVSAISGRCLPCEVSSKRAARHLPISELFVRSRSVAKLTWPPAEAEAAREFQEIAGHRGITIGNAFGVLAHLSLARACALQGNTAKARAAYRDFLTLSRDTDPDILILKYAKAESGSCSDFGAVDCAASGQTAVQSAEGRPSELRNPSSDAATISTSLPS